MWVQLSKFSECQDINKACLENKMMHTMNEVYVNNKTYMLKLKTDSNGTEQEIGN